MKDNQAKYPQLRFKGFTDPWVQRKLCDLGSVAMNKRIFKEQTSDTGDVPFYKIGTFGGTPDAFISRDLFEEYKSKYQYPEVGDILISASGSIGRTVVYRGADEYFQDSNIVWLKHDSQLVNSFLKQFYSIVKWQGLEGSTIKRLYNKNILETPITLPSPEEQTKLGEFFEKLDNLIAANQRKLDLLKEQKKGYLQKMFPKNGAKVPELRFAGFADAWEERKLRDLLNKNSEKNKNLSVINVESVSNKTGFTKQTDQFEDYSVASADLSNYYVIREKQFAYNPSRINVGSIAYKDLGDEISVVSPLYVSFSTKKILNDGFLWNWFKTASFDAQRQRLSAGGVRDTLSFNQLSEMNTMFPTYPEQQKIGSFFKQLDNTIALHQRKLEKLQELKKGYLQKMFC
ncbi:restriction endonuclease subunit S [Lactiplantibacillus pentosus]